MTTQINVTMIGKEYVEYIIRGLKINFYDHVCCAWDLSFITICKIIKITEQVITDEIQK